MSEPATDITGPHPGRTIMIDDLIGELQRIRENFGNTTCFVSGLAWGSVALWHSSWADEYGHRLLDRCVTELANGVPVWHLHESLDRLKRLACDFYTVALGSSGEWSTPGSPSWWERMNEVMAAVCENGQPVCKLHGLRMLAPKIIQRVPLASADSTNAARNGGDSKRFLKHLAAWQRAGAIADNVEAVRCAERWVPVKVRQDTMPLFGAEMT